MSLPPWSVYPLLLCFLFSRMTLAQPSTTAQCDKSFTWMDNSDGQSPCLVAAYAFSACSSADINIPSATNTSYNPPAGDNVTPCACSSVTYALLNACSGLEGMLIENISWATWSQNCPSYDITNGSNDIQRDAIRFPEGVDMEAVIPPWAFQLVQPSVVEYNHSTQCGGRRSGEWNDSELYVHPETASIHHIERGHLDDANIKLF
ncbi:hypothetical protein PHLGIDRAFT_12416 [Phlebiopsis gigantea 11061_1 CR5-6]|uniref:Uncharacterized protein n=1 Tax=Phlebiopsis gigantea (strain 11061_1 CR5-6) TaxID=745531 RepID=A0A0C3SCD8_PHLG1|nr:hypothetical protein PHLGIDRAFT_12416 [Phlebiopsis gigantea 11061_1 CR5-6]